MTKRKACAIIKTLQGGARATAGSGDTSPSKTTQHLRWLVKHGATQKGRGALPLEKKVLTKCKMCAIIKTEMRDGEQSPRDRRGEGVTHESQ